MRRTILGLVGAASMFGLIAGNGQAQDVVCPSPDEVAGFRTCAGA